MKKKKQTYILFDFGLQNSTTIYNDKLFKIKGDIINKLLSIIAVDYIYKQPNPQGYIEIPASILKKTHSNYKPYIYYLIYNNIIECDNYFVYKHQNKVSHPELYELLSRTKCMGYRFSWDFSNSVNIYKTIYYRKSTQKKSIKKQKKNSKKIDSIIVDYPQISINPETFNRLRRDFRSAQITTLIPRKINQPDSSYVDLSRWFRNILLLHKWKNISSTFKLKANRIYSNFTFLSSQVRKECIILSGEAIQELDIHNSFPTMLALYVLKQNPELINDYDFIKYCSWVKSGRFYDKLVDLLNKALDSDTTTREKKYKKQFDMAIKHFEETGEKLKIKDLRDIPKRKLSRKATKELFQIYLNGEKKRNPLLKGFGDSFIRKQMKQYFPCIDEIVSNDKANKAMIYYILSKIETEFIIGIIEELYANYTNIRLLTCHDSIYYHGSFKVKVEEVWYRHLSELFNTLPDDGESEETKAMCEELENWFENEDDSDYVEDKDDDDFFDEDDKDFYNDFNGKKTNLEIVSKPIDIQLYKGSYYDETEKIFADYLKNYKK